MTPNEKAALILKSRTTKDLIDDFVFTAKVVSENIYTVRGWILDELERRNPEAFTAWLDFDATDEALHHFFNC